MSTRRFALAAIALSTLTALPADAGFGGLIRGAAKASSSASRASSSAARSSARVMRSAPNVPRHLPATPAAPMASVPVQRGVVRSVKRLPPEQRQNAALVIVMSSGEDASMMRAARLSDNIAAEESAAARAARSADAEAEAAAKNRKELVKNIIESSPDAVEAMLDANDAAEGKLDSDEVPSVDHAEWVRHAQRLKRIDALYAAGEIETSKRLKAKEIRRHELMLARLYAKVSAQ